MVATATDNQPQVQHIISIPLTPGPTATTGPRLIVSILTDSEEGWMAYFDNRHLPAQLAERATALIDELWGMWAAAFKHEGISVEVELSKGDLK